MLIPVLLLLSLGTTVIFTSTPNLAYQQAFYALLGTIGYFAVSLFDYRSIKNLLPPFYFITLLLLILVFILGIESRGSVRWISLGFVSIQPSELAKLSLILILASFWSQRGPTWKNIFLSALILAPYGALVFVQPDLGTMLTISFIWLIMLFAANVSLMKLVVMGLTGVITAPIVWLFLHDYQRNRIVSFLSPAHDPLGIGYNVIQSQIAVGSGQLFGRGLGRGTQSRLQFLPEFRTDFIFAFIAEELGFFGSFIVLILYGLIFWLCFSILRTCEDRFGQFIIIGVLGMLFFQIVVNIGMNIGIMPVTGITLPLLSYGGSSIITTLLSLGFVQSVHRFGVKHRMLDRASYVG